MREPTIKKKVFIKTNDVETNIYFNQSSIISLGDIENNGVNNKKNKDNARPQTNIFSYISIILIFLTIFLTKTLRKDWTR